MKEALLVHFLNLFRSKELTQDRLVIAMQVLILPMLVRAFQNIRLAIELVGLLVASEKRRQAWARVVSDMEGHVQSMDMPSLTPAT